MAKTTKKAAKPVAKTGQTVKKAAPKASAVKSKKTATPVKSAKLTTKKATVKKAPMPAQQTSAVKEAPHQEGLHYNKAKLLTGYSDTFRIMMIATAVSIGFIVVYFMVFVVYLGGFSHSKHAPFHEKFADRIDLSGSYDGTPLPIYQQNN